MVVGVGRHHGRTKARSNKERAGMKRHIYRALLSQGQKKNGTIGLRSNPDKQTDEKSAPRAFADIAGVLVASPPSGSCGTTLGGRRCGCSFDRSARVVPLHGGCLCALTFFDGRKPLLGPIRVLFFGGEWQFSPDTDLAGDLRHFSLASGDSTCLT